MSDSDRKSWIPPLVLLCSSSLVMAGEPSTEEGYHTFDERYDSITATEESARTIPEFNQVDADQNGAISKAEANQVPGLVDQFSLADRNADGWVNTDEFRVLEDPSKT